MTCSKSNCCSRLLKIERGHQGLAMSAPQVAPCLPACRVSGALCLAAPRALFCSWKKIQFRHPTIPSSTAPHVHSLEYIIYMRTYIYVHTHIGFNSGMSRRVQLKGNRRHDGEKQRKGSGRKGARQRARHEGCCRELSLGRGVVCATTLDIR